MKHRLFKITAFLVLLTACTAIGIFMFTAPLALEMTRQYEKTRSRMIFDRSHELIAIEQNSAGYYSRLLEKIPKRFEKLLLKKEDRFFYFHFGINPLSSARAAYGWAVHGTRQGGSTITQQLAKILLKNEQERTFANKLRELVYAISIEAHLTKKEILRMYADSIYFGNLAQGLGEASEYYFGKQPDALNDAEIIKLLSFIGRPSSQNRREALSVDTLPGLAARLGVSKDALSSLVPVSSKSAARENRKSPTWFELQGLSKECTRECSLTADKALGEKLREMMKTNLLLPSLQSANNSAIVVLKLPENELLAIVGSPDPFSLTNGYQINMAISPRPIGSTAKPFIYLQAFEKGARPYTLAKDREYKYETGSGFGFYPKNYDGKYRGEVTLHRALSNSLNVPSVKVLEFVGLENFYSFLQNDLAFQPVQPLENYKLGIALGGLEMDLLTLSAYCTIFPQEGVLAPVIIGFENNAPLFADLPHAQIITAQKRVARSDMVQLINSILSDREAGIEQFGLISNLTLSQKNYALKTGTSRDFHDSWVVGYTPDFLIGVWVGNSDNTKTDNIASESGAGKMWHDAMEILFATPYNKKTEFRFNEIKAFNQSGSQEYGLASDKYETARNIMRESSFILSPHEGDVFLYEDRMAIPLISSEPFSWYANGEFLGDGANLTWRPDKPGVYHILGETKGKREELVVTINSSWAKS